MCRVRGVSAESGPVGLACGRDVPPSPAVAGGMGCAWILDPGLLVFRLCVEAVLRGSREKRF